MTLTTKSRLNYFAICLATLSVVSSYGLGALFHSYDELAKSWLGVFTIAQYFGLTIAMIIAWYAAPRSNQLSDYRFLIYFAVLAHLVLIPIESYTSNDVSRYLFDGKLFVDGFDPYRTPHNAPEVNEIRHLWQPPSEHLSYVTLYPPLAILLFGLAANAGVEWAGLVWSTLVAFSAIGTLWICTLILMHIRRLHYLPLVALSPLLILETGIGGHIDSVLTLAVSVAVLMWLKQRYFLTGLFIGLGALIKFLPILLLLPLTFSSKKVPESVKMITGTLGLLFIAYSITVLIGLVPIGSIDVFFQKWRFGSPLFATLESITSVQAHMAIAAGILIMLSGLIAVVAWRMRSVRNVAIVGLLMQLTMALPFLLGPVVFPWYLCVLVPLLILRPNATLLLWMTLLPFTYEVLGLFVAEGLWQPAIWPLLLIAYGLMVGLAIDYKGIFLKRKTVMNLWLN